MKTVCHVPKYTVHLVLVTKEDTRRTYTFINFKTLPERTNFCFCLVFKILSQVHLWCGV